jgi:ribokinase
VDQMAGRRVPHVDVLIANEGEAAALGGDSVRKAVGALAVTFGARGSVLYEGARVTELKPQRVTAVDATAAGDALVGATAFALARGATVNEALRLGNAAGAAAVTRMGAQPSLPTLWDLKRLFDIDVEEALRPA